MHVLGIDIGGSGIKGAPVDVSTGTLLADRHKILTPQPATPAPVTSVVVELVAHFDWDGPVGCTFPAVVRRGVVETAANVDPSWIGVDGQALMTEATGLPVTMLNDADAAGLAEATFGAAQGSPGVVILLTFGTGIGSALLNGGVLVPNTELGHVEFRGDDAEHYAAARVRKAEGLSWDEWGDRVDEVLRYFDTIFSPDLFIVGGGVSRKFDKFAPRLQVGTAVAPAKLRNEAGIVGAALAASR